MRASRENARPTLLRRVLACLVSAAMVVAFTPVVAFAAPEGVSYIALEGTGAKDSGEGYAYLVDGDTKTKWCVTNFSSAYIIFETPSPIAASGYSITTGGDNAAYTGRNPKDWTLYGCSNYTGSSSDTWTQIHSVSNDTVLQDENEATYQFTFDKLQTAYRYFKLEISAVQSGNVMQMGEFTLTCVHEWGEPVTTAATCTTAGFTSRTCGSCQDVWVYDQTEPLGHDFTGEGGACRHCGYTRDALLESGYLDEDGRLCPPPLPIRSVSDADTEWTAGWYVLDRDVTIGSRVTVTGDVHLILKDGCTLTAIGGVGVDDDDWEYRNGSANSLTVYGQAEGTGALVTSNVYDHDAGIGGTDNIHGDGGTITINGGTINASSTMGAGIGGGVGQSDSHGGTITINGGTVTAGSEVGAGIGGSWVNSGQSGPCNGGIVTVSGGIVTATTTNSSSANAIGHGCDGTGGSFSTGSDGNAVMYLYPCDPHFPINETSDKSAWSGVIFVEGTGYVFGSNVEPDRDFTIKVGCQLEVGSGKTLTIPEGVVLTIEKDGTWWPTGHLLNNGTVVNKGTIENKKPLSASNTGITNNGTISNQGRLVNGDGLANTGTISNEGAIENDGALDNSGTVFDFGAASTENISSGETGRVITPPVARSLTYNGSSQDLLEACPGSDGYVQYRLAGAEGWGTAIPTAVDARPYTVFYRAAVGGNAVSSEKVLEAAIGKAGSAVSSAPTARTLAYTGTEQELVAAGSAAGGTMQYRLGESGEWSAYVPKATAAGRYTVYYKVVGDGNHTDSAASSLTASIEKAGINPAASLAGWTYGESANRPSVTGNPGSGAVAYAYKARGADDSAYRAEVPTSAGDYTVRAVVAETENYLGNTAVADFTIAQREVGIQWGDTELTYTGQAQAPSATATNRAGTDAVALTVEGAQTNASTNTYTATVTAITGSAAANYKLPAAATTSFTISKASPSVVITASKDKLSGGGSVTLTVASSGLPNDGAVNVTCSDDTVKVTAQEGGTYSADLPNATRIYTFTASYSGDGNRNAASASCQVAVTQYIPPLPSYSVPVTGEGSVEVRATINGTTAVVGEISAKALESAVAGGEGGEAVATVTIDLSGLPQGVTQAQLSKSTVENLLAVVSDEGNAVESVTVELGGAAVVVDAKALAAIAEQAEGGSVTLGVKQAEGDSLNSAQQQALSGYEIVELYFEAQVKSGNTEIHDFNGGSVRVSVAFAPRPGHNPARYVVLYVAEGGQLERYATAWANGMLSFTAPHFSAYAVVYVEDATQAAIDALEALPDAGKLKTSQAKAAVKKAKAALAQVAALDDGQKALVDEALVTNAQEMVATGSALIAKADKNAVGKVKNKRFSVKAGKSKSITFKTKASTAGTKVTYAKTKGSKYITVTKSGKVTAKKGMKKGKTYTAKVKVTCGAATKIVKVIVRVKK